ncbi:MAG: hypothetical protein J0665_01460 [Deltaproteobacteria bacterium]|nr:hypothetical protein [Deltaproteobacteria bacterium]
MTLDDQLNVPIFFHLEEHTSGRHIVQSLKEDYFARTHIAPEKGIAKSSFFEAMNARGLKQFLYVFDELQKQAGDLLPQIFPELGQLVVLDGSLIDAVLSMAWADYRGGSKKTKKHIGFDINRGIPRKYFSLMEKVRIGLLSARSWSLMKQAGLTEDISPIKTLIFSRGKTFCLPYQG